MTSNVTGIIDPSSESFPFSTSSTSAASGDTSTYDVTPPIDAAPFDYVIYMPDLGAARHQWTDDRAFLPTTLTYSLTFVLGVLGNSVVVFALLGDARGRSVTSSFLASLAVADVIFLVVCVPYEIGAKMSSIWNGGNFLCKMAGFVEMLSGCSSVLNLTAVSIERYAVIVHPIKARSWCSSGRTNRILFIVWTSAIIISSPAVYIMKKTQGLFYNSDNYVIVMTCSDNNVSETMERIVFSWYQLVIMFVLPVVVIIFCYVYVIRVLWQSTKDLDRLTQGERFSEEECRQRLTQSRNRLRYRSADVGHFDARKARIQVIKMLLTIIVIFFFCWGPKYVLNIMKRHELSILHTDSAFHIMLIVNLMPYVQSCVNPVIYSFMSNNFRSSLRTQFRRLRQCCFRFPAARRHPRSLRYRSDGTGAVAGTGAGGAYDLESIDRWSTGGRATRLKTVTANTCESALSEV